MAIVDLDKDGRPDVVINNNNDAPTIYLNRLPATGNWFRCNLVGAAGKDGSNPDALGARVTVRATISGGPRQLVRWVEAGSGYATQSEATLHFGLGDSRSLDGLTIAWPSGTTQEIAGKDLKGLLNRECTIVENRGIIPLEGAAGESTPGGHPATPDVPSPR